MDKIKIYQIIFWTSLLSIIVWIILKSPRIINTPTYIQLFPYTSAVFAAGAFFQLVIENNKKLKILKKRFNHHIEHH